MGDTEWQGVRAVRWAAPGVLLLTLGLLAGCGRADTPDAAGTAAGTSAADPGAAAAGAAASEDAPTDDAQLVTAVDAHTSGQTKAVTVKFRIEARPIVGVPVKVLLAVTPADDSDIERIHGSFNAPEGLLMQSTATFDLSDVKAGTPQYREVTVVAQQTGVLDLNATLSLQTDKLTETRTYTIPLIAADNSGSP